MLPIYASHMVPYMKDGDSRATSSSGREENQSVTELKKSARQG